LFFEIGQGILFRRGQGCWRGAPILVAEPTGMRDGIRAALATGYHHSIVEGDSKVIIQVV